MEFAGTTVERQTPTASSTFDPPPRHCGPSLLLSLPSVAFTRNKPPRRPSSVLNVDFSQRQLAGKQGERRARGCNHAEPGGHGRRHHRAIITPLTQHPSASLMDSINNRPLLLPSMFNTRHQFNTDLISLRPRRPRNTAVIHAAIRY